MVTAKPRFEQQTGEWVRDVEFGEAELAMLQSIKNDHSFVSDIRNIATVYGCLYRSETDELSAGEVKAALADLKQNASALAEKLEKIPQSVEAQLWGVSYRRDSPPIMENLKTLLVYLVDEIEGALDKEPGRPGRKRATANWYATKSLVRCFKSYGLPITVNQFEGYPSSPATSCLQLIFASSNCRLSRSGVEEYLQAYKGENHP